MAAAGRADAHERDREKDEDEIPDLVVAASGNLANIYFTEASERMSLEEFLTNNRGINDGESFPEDFMKLLYDSITDNEIKMSDDADGSGITADIWDDRLRQARSLDRPMRAFGLQQPWQPADPCCPTASARSRARPVVQVAEAGSDGSCEHGVGCRVAAGDVGARGGLCGGVRGLQVRRLPLHRTFPPWGRVCSLNEESAVVI